ncbi:Hemerythrin-like, metal-binding protein [Candidatus Koribacter versatilis Ellin345]|uniref:Hemerythrin-like, metal-binding protein n=1 Tax=Koribacter versatilis (strain Ellin345) TaxID=204669 RepID=Q1IKE8_KORVE|nr:hemerythrin family protein [Candidatus Koribacter versatilis]ABF42652.1 Hemerythrin-like, metal-binding protein [Candidatus Koribacter versatilis Ellin345]
MPDLQWKDSDSVGIASLDAQHQGLFATAHRLRDAMRSGRAATIQQEILAELGAYTRSHFEREERVMQICAFPALCGHQHLHRSFLEQLQAIQAELRSDRSGITPDRMEFMRVWMRKHVAIEDAQYATWIHRRELPVHGLTTTEIQEKQKCHF